MQFGFTLKPDHTIERTLSIRLERRGVATSVPHATKGTASVIVMPAVEAPKKWMKFGASKKRATRRYSFAV